MARRPDFICVLFWVTFWPGAVLAAMAAPVVWQARREPGAQFLLAWLVPSWLVFEVVMTKLPHYVLPLYPAIAILIAGILEMRQPVQGALAGARHDRLVSVSREPSRSRVLIGFIMFGRDLGLVAWPFAAAGGDLRPVRLVAL